MKNTIKLIESEISTARLLNTLEGFTQYHRVQASPGHRAAINYIASVLESYGVKNRVLRYESDYGLKYLGNPVFKEWGCKDAELQLTYPQNTLLADYKAMATSILQKSGPCDYRNTPLDIVYLDKGNKEEDYPEDLDLKGKLIFIRGDYRPYIEWAVNKRGAVGIVGDYSDSDRGTQAWFDLADINKYRGIFYFAEPEYTPFGFVITPNQGEMLAKLCAQTAAEHAEDPSKPAYPQATCFVDAEFYKGEIEDAEAEVTGTGDEEVWILAHSCHPKRCANDNGSGVTAAVEAINVLNRLIEQGRLPRPKRSIKILLMAEFTGTFPYLANEGQPEACKAALNMDMVGGSQALGYGPLIVVSLPNSTPSITDDLCACVLNELKKEVPHYYGGEPSLALFNSTRAPYMGGSDHLILSDPAVGIPTPALMQWPDTFYHTSGDTMAIISPDILKKSTAISASYAYLMANLSVDDLKLVFRESLSQFVQKMNEAIAGHQAGEGLSLRKKLNFIHEYYQTAAEKAADFFSGEEKAEAQKLIAGQQSFLSESLQSFLSNFTNASEQENEPDASDSRVPLRTVPAMNMRMELNAVSPEQKEALETHRKMGDRKLKQPGTVYYLAQCYADGKRSLDEIADRILFDTGNTSRQPVFDLFNLFEALDIVRFV